MYKMIYLITLLSIIPFQAQAATSSIYATLPTGSFTAALASSASGIIYSDNKNAEIKEINGTGGFTTIALSGGVIGTPQATLIDVAGVATDSLGNIYYSDSGANTITMITRTTTAMGAPVIIAGTGLAGYTGDGGAATAATLSSPVGIAVDFNGDVYFADMGNSVIRKIDMLTGTISTFAGTGTAGYTGDGGAATAADLNAPYGLAFDGSGTSLYITDIGSHTVREVFSGTIQTIAGTGVAGFTGDDGIKTFAQLNTPMGVTVDSLGKVYIADTGNSRIRIIDGSFINSVAGVTTPSPTAITVDSSDRLYVPNNTALTITMIEGAVSDSSTVVNPTASCISGSTNRGTFLFMAIALLLFFNFKVSGFQKILGL